MQPTPLPATYAQTIIFRYCTEGGLNGPPFLLAESQTERLETRIAAIIEPTLTDMGYEFVFDAKDGQGGVYLYDFASGTYFYTSPSFGFPYLYDFSRHAVVYYYPDASNPGRYNTSGVRWFYDYSTRTVFSK